MTTHTEYSVSVVEIFPERCSLTWGVLPCRARFGYSDNVHEGPQGVGFVPANDNYLTRGAGLTGAADSKLFTLSGWVRRYASGAVQFIFGGLSSVGGTTPRFYVQLDSSNRLEVIGENSAGTTILNIRSSALTADVWHHFLVSCNMANTSQRHLYIDNASDLATVTTYTDAAIDFTLADWAIGAEGDGSNPLDGDLMDLWFLPGTYTDFSVAGNRAEFIATTLRPVWLGDDGEVPTGSSPLVFFSGAWEENLGTGGAFELASGSLSEATFTTGTRKCFNSLGTCQDRESFDPEEATAMRFARNADYLPKDIEAHPCIRSISYVPATLSLGKDLGIRATLSVTMQDFPDSDTGFFGDKYPSDRDYVPYDTGSFFGKFRARNPFLQGRTLIYYEGVLGQSLDEMDKLYFKIESFNGPDENGVFTIFAKDDLKLVDGDRALAPRLSNGILNANIDADDTAAVLAPTGIGNEEYPASGYVTIGGTETCAFTRSGDNLTLTRGAFNTTPVAHEAEDRVQLGLYYDSVDPAEVIEDLLTYTEVLSSQVDIDAWLAETEGYYRRLITAFIPEPTPVRQLISEVIEQVGLVMWGALDENSSIRLQVLREIPTDAEVFDDDNIIEDSFHLQEQPNARVSDVIVRYGLSNPLLEIDDPLSYRSGFRNFDDVSILNYGSSKFYEVNSRWIPQFGSSPAERLTDIILARFSVPPRRFQFELWRQGQIEPILGGGYRLRIPDLQIDTGEQDDVPIQITRLGRDAERWYVEAEELRWTGVLTDEELADRSVTIFSNTFDFNMRTVHDALYPSPVAGDSFTVIINSGVIVGSTSLATPAFDVGSWPEQAEASVTRTNGSAILTGLADTSVLEAGMFVRGTGIPNGTKILTVDSASQITLDANASSSGTSAITVYLVFLNIVWNGRIQGMGGTGGNGVDTFGATDDGEPGVTGGTAFYSRYPVTVTYGAASEAWAGGGGGGGGAAGYAHLGGGGGGGAGTNGGLPGLNQDGGSTALDTLPTAGTSEAGGTGGGHSLYTHDTFGGAGGGPGLAGSPGWDYGGGQQNANARQGGAGGAAGNALDGVSYIDIAVDNGVDIRGSQVN